MRSLAILLTLASCGPLVTDSPALSITRGLFSAGSAETVRAGPVAGLSRDAIASLPNEVMLVSVLERQTTALVAKAGENAGKETWVSPDGISLTFENGLLISTRGLGFDLMSVQIGQPLAQIHDGDTYMRRHEYLDGRNQISTQDYQCTISSEGERSITIVELTYTTEVLREDCIGATQRFQNSYWRGQDGTIWQARHWVSAEIGIIGNQRLQ